MFANREFRITINLTNFFHDHRNRARIFINDNIQTISDLQKRIENIFHIENFHLTSQNEFLPPSEDVRILQKDDIIWVMQNGDKYNSTCTSEMLTKKTTKKTKTDSKKRSISLSDEEESEFSKKKKKKKPTDPDKNEEENTEFISSINQVVKKKKKKKKHAGNAISEEDDINMDVDNASTKKEKIKGKILDENSSNKLSTTSKEEANQSKKSNVMKINTLLPVLHSHISTYNKKICSQLNKTNDSMTKSLEILSPKVTEKNEMITESGRQQDKKEQYSCKGNLASYKKSVLLPTITDQYLQQKKINIVKIEYLAGSPVQINDLEKKSNKGSEIINKVLTTDSNTNQSSVGIVNQRANDSPRPDSLCSDLPSTFIPPQGATTAIESFGEDVNMGASPADTKERASDFKKENLLPNQNGTCNEIDKTLSVLSIHEEPQIVLENSFSGEMINTILPHKKKSSNEKEIGDTNSNNGSLLQADIGTNSKVSSPYIEEARDTSKRRSLTSVSNDGICKQEMLPSEDITHKIKEAEESSLSTITSAKLSATDIASQLKYPSLRGMVATKDSFVNSTDINYETLMPATSTINITPTKENLLVKDPYNNEKKSLPKDIDSEGQQFNINVASSHTNKASKTAYESFRRETETSYGVDTFQETLGETCMDISQIDDSLWTNVSNKHPPKLSESNTDFVNNTMLESLPSISRRETNDLARDNIGESVNPLDDNIRNSIDSELDLTKDVASNFSRSTSKFSIKRQLSGIGQLLEELRSNCSVASIETVDSDCSEFVTKRVRKRTRKRRKKVANGNSDTSLNDSSLVINDAFIPKPINIKACPSIHIKFEDGEGSEDDLKVINKISNTVTENESYVDTSCVENITINSDVEESKLEAFYLKEEDIVKSPSMKKMLPKVGDFIAFKILRITESYTPEISSYITGKVIEFNTDTKELVFEILMGLDQCEEPKGKLCIEERAESNETKDKKRVMTWVDLIDPRLIFP